MDTYEVSAKESQKPRQKNIVDAQGEGKRESIENTIQCLFPQIFLLLPSYLRVFSTKKS